MDAIESQDALAQLGWLVELGADEAILDAPVNRFELPQAAPKPAAPKPSAPPASAPPPVPQDATEAAGAAAEIAKEIAAGAQNLDELHEALAGFQHCDLRQGARNLVFSDGNPHARVMIVGEAPGRDEDRMGKPFVGRAGQLLDAMFDAIGLSRHSEDAATALYITNMLPWRPPQNRDPSPEELSMMGPFVRRHIELADPDILVLMGNHACQGLIGRKGITRLRGDWAEVMGRPALPMFHPAYLLRKPHEKAKAWTDLLALQAKLRTL